ncbi:MAG: hypothetical protein WD646_06295 [Actinomycetota bacterium]
MTLSRLLVAFLMVVAAVGAIARSINGSDVARVAGVLAALALGTIAVGVIRERMWALGAAFFIGLCWLWAIIALRVQGVLGAPEIALWIAWSILVMVMTVRMRPG